MFRRATQTREVDVLSRFLGLVKKAHSTLDFAPVEAMIDPGVVLRTRDREEKGIAAVVAYLKEMGKSKYQAHIVAPKGGLTTVLISEVLIDGGRGNEHEQIYRLYRDKIVELIDLGRSPGLVSRPLSQPY